MGHPVVLGQCCHCCALLHREQPTLVCRGLLWPQASQWHHWMGRWERASLSLLISKNRRVDSLGSDPSTSPSGCGSVLIHHNFSPNNSPAHGIPISSHFPVPLISSLPDSPANSGPTRADGRQPDCPAESKAPQLTILFG